MTRLPQTVTTLSEFVEWVEAVSDEFSEPAKAGDGRQSPGIWFRGVSDSRYKLLPGLYRPGICTSDSYQDTDDELRYEFRRRARALAMEITPTDDWEWYFIMQHYRVPTRLLDWTDAAFVALHFAVQGWTGEGRPAVWAFNPFAMNGHLGFDGPVGTDWDKAAPYLPEPYLGKQIPTVPIAIDPPLVARRMLVQHSHFTLHGADTRPLEDMQLLQGENKLTKVVIEMADADSRQFLLWQLELCAILETSVFPDLEGLSRELIQEYDLGTPMPARLAPLGTSIEPHRPPSPTQSRGVDDKSRRRARVANATRRMRPR